VSEVAFGEFNDSVSSFREQGIVLLFGDADEVFFHCLAVYAAEAEYGTSALDGFDDFAGLVTDKDESGGARTDFHDTTQRGLGWAGHLVAFVKDDEGEWDCFAEACAAVATEVFDAVAYGIDASFI